MFFVEIFLTHCTLDGMKNKKMRIGLGINNHGPVNEVFGPKNVPPPEVSNSLTAVPRLCVNRNEDNVENGTESHRGLPVQQQPHRPLI